MTGSNTDPRTIDYAAMREALNTMLRLREEGGDVVRVDIGELTLKKWKDNGSIVVDADPKGETICEFLGIPARILPGVEGIRCVTRADAEAEESRLQMLTLLAQKPEYIPAFLVTSVV